MSPSRVPPIPTPLALAERRAENELFREANTYVLAMLRRFGIPEADREDWAQKILLAAYERRHTYNPAHATPRQWLHAFIWHFAYHCHRDRRRRAPTVPLEAVEVEIIHQARGAESQIMAEEYRRLLYDTLFPAIEFEKLAVLLAHDIDEIPMKDIAAMHQIPLSTAYHRYHRAHHELAAAYAEWQKQQRDRGLMLLPLSLSQLLQADRTIPLGSVPPSSLAAPLQHTAEPLQDKVTRPFWKQVLRSRAKRSLRGLLRRPEAHIGAAFISGVVVTAAITSAVKSPARESIRYVLVQPSPSGSAAAMIPLEPVPLGTATPDPPLNEAAKTVALENAQNPTSAAAMEPLDSDIEHWAFDAAHRAFDRGDTKATMGVLEEHQRLFPEGRFSPEREVLWIKSLVKLGRVEEARARLGRLRAMEKGRALAEELEPLLSNASASTR